MISQEARTVRGKLARASREDGDAQVAESLRRDYRYVVARDYVEELVASAPPLTAAQRRDLARLLAPTAGGDR